MSRSDFSSTLLSCVCVWHVFGAARQGRTVLFRAAWNESRFRSAALQRSLVVMHAMDACNGCVRATVVRRVHLTLSEPGPLENGKGNLMKNAMAWVALYCIVFIYLLNYLIIFQVFIIYLLECLR